MRRREAADGKTAGDAAGVEDQHRTRVDGRGSGFSLEAPEGKRFLIRSRIFSDDEYRSLVDAGVLAG